MSLKLVGNKKVIYAAEQTLNDTQYQYTIYIDIKDNNFAFNTNLNCLGGRTCRFPQMFPVFITIFHSHDLEYVLMSFMNKSVLETEIFFFFERDCRVWSVLAIRIEICILNLILFSVNLRKNFTKLPIYILSFHRFYAMPF